MNANLGLFDMILALSANKINAQFQFLFNQKKIPTQWCFLTDRSGKHTLRANPNDKDEFNNFKSVLNLWTTNSNVLKQEIETITQKIDAEKIKGKSAIYYDLLEQKQALIDRKEQLMQIQHEYECGIDVQIDAPIIDILNDKPNELLFKIPIRSGNLYYNNGAEIKLFSLTSCVYAFHVAIGNKIAYKTDLLKMVELNKMPENTVADEEIKTYIITEITDNLFDIQALFLDFTNTNISQYDKAKSNLPTEVFAATSLQLTLTNYFSTLPTSDNPYILGFNISRKNAQKIDALFEATTVKYTTSYSRNKGDRYHAFNFLMQTNGHELPKDGRAGVLPQSMIELANDQSATVNGVFGINYEIFKEVYVEKNLLVELKNRLSLKISSNFQNYEVTRKMLDNHRMEFGISKENFFLNLIYKNFNIRSGDAEKKGLLLEWDIEVSGKSHREVPKKILGIEIGTIAMYQAFSTNGRFEIEGKKARQGTFSVLISASERGKLFIETSTQTPIVAKETETPQYYNEQDRTKDTLLSVAHLFTGEIVTVLKQIENAKIFHIEISEKDFEQLKLDDLGELSNKVILPGSNTFAFKTLRLLNGQKDAQDAVLFDITYAPIQKK